MLRERPPPPPQMLIAVDVEWEGQVTERDVVLYLNLRPGTDRYDLAAALHTRLAGDYQFDQVRLAWRDPRHGPLLTEPFEPRLAMRTTDYLLSYRAVLEMIAVQRTVMLMPLGYGAGVDEFRCRWCHKIGAPKFVFAHEEILPFCNQEHCDLYMPPWLASFQR